MCKLLIITRALIHLGLNVFNLGLNYKPYSPLIIQNGSQCSPEGYGCSLLTDN